MKGVRLIISDACRGLVQAAAEVFPKTQWQRCAAVHFYRNVFRQVPNGKMAEVARVLKVIHAQEDLREAQKNANEIVTRLKEMNLQRAAELVEEKVSETLCYYQYHSTHWRQIRTNNPLKRIIGEIRRRTRHIAPTKWGKRRYMLMEPLLNPAKQEAAA
jgi:putative transposase